MYQISVLGILSQEDLPGVQASLNFRLRPCLVKEKKVYKIFKK